MATLSSSSTLAQVQAAYDDNCAYDLDGSEAKCKAFIEACRILLRRVPAEAQQGGQNRIRVELQRIESELNAAKSWLVANASSSASGGSKFLSFEDYRS